jgi:hypothetical protein
MSNFVSQVNTVKLTYQKELVTVALMQPLAAIGSANHITFVDMRCGHIAHTVESLDEGWGKQYCDRRTCIK